MKPVCFTEHISSRIILIMACVTILIFLRLNNIPFYVFIPLCLPIHSLMDSWFTSNLLTIVNLLTYCCYDLENTNIWDFVFNSSGYISKVKLLDHMVILFLIFWGTAILFSIIGAPFYIPTNSTQGHLIFHILLNTVGVCFFFFNNKSF